MKSKSITHRWVINSLGVILFILVGLEIVFGFGVKTYFYDFAKRSLENKATMISAQLTYAADSDTGNYGDAINELVQNFDDKNTTELMAINNFGEIAMTSSGFSYDSDVRMNDYQDAQTDPRGRGYYVGNDNNGNRIMAYTVRLEVNSDYAALRLVTSTDNIDNVILSAIARVRPWWEMYRAFTARNCRLNRCAPSPGWA